MSLDNMLVLHKSKVVLQVQGNCIYRGIDAHGPMCQERKNTK